MTEVINLILGAFLPPVIDLINLKVTDTKLRYTVSFSVCVTIAVLVALFTNNFNWQTVLKGIPEVFISAQTIYKLYWRDSAVRNQ